MLLARLLLGLLRRTFSHLCRPCFYTKRLTLDTVNLPELSYRGVPIFNDISQEDSYILASHGSVKGNFWGVNAGYEYKEVDSIYFRVDALWSTGKLKGTDRASSSRYHTWDIDARIGYTFGSCGACAWTVTPYIGLGYAWDKNDLHCVNYTLKYRNYYVPVGILADMEVMCDFWVGLDAAWVPQFDPKVEVDSGHEYDLKQKAVGTCKFLLPTEFAKIGVLS
jgi:Autotransporter beta-domain.